MPTEESLLSKGREDRAFLLIFVLIAALQILNLLVHPWWAHPVLHSLGLIGSICLTFGYLTRLVDGAVGSGLMALHLANDQEHHWWWQTAFVKGFSRAPHFGAIFLTRLGPLMIGASSMHPIVMVSFLGSFILGFSRIRKILFSIWDDKDDPEAPNKAEEWLKRQLAAREWLQNRQLEPTNDLAWWYITSALLSVLYYVSGWGSFGSSCLMFGALTVPPYLLAEQLRVMAKYDPVWLTRFVISGIPMFIGAYLLGETAVMWFEGTANPAVLVFGYITFGFVSFVRARVNKVGLIEYWEPRHPWVAAISRRLVPYFKPIVVLVLFIRMLRGDYARLRLVLLVCIVAGKR